LAAIGQMVAGLAHESRNALARSQACLEMLALAVRDQPGALDLIKRLQHAQDHLHTLYEDVRSYAAPINLEKKPCDLRQVWREAWAHLEPATREKHAVLRELSEAVDLQCTVDPFRMGQVFHNILENALAACSPPVEIEITAAAARVDGRPAICVRVRDNGPGISADQRPRIFDPFFTTKAKGTGLGMAIVKRIVEAHGGQIALGDGNEPGAVFLLTLPKGPS
jgi:signal transduction histidine kinase